MTKLLLDTDVIIDYLRDRPEAVDFFENLDESIVLISVITVAELFAGARATEKSTIENLIYLFEEINVDRKIAETGGQFRQQYMKSHNVGIADALIAASAKLHHATLVTLNKKDYPMLDKILVPYVKHK